MKTGNDSIKRFGYNLAIIVKNLDDLHQVSKCSLEMGDYVFIKTVNSLYTIRKRPDNLYEVSGGWFDRRGLSPAVLTIRGCTWGGRIINMGVVAARGLYLEFGNNLITSPIRKILVIKARQLN